MMYEIITVNKKLKFVSFISMQETNLNYDTTVIKLCVMLRNVYGIMLLRKLCDYMIYVTTKK